MIRKQELRHMYETTFYAETCHPGSVSPCSHACMNVYYHIIYPPSVLSRLPLRLCLPNNRFANLACSVSLLLSFSFPSYILPYLSYTVSTSNDQRTISHPTQPHRDRPCANLASLK